MRASSEARFKRASSDDATNHGLSPPNIEAVSPARIGRRDQLELSSDLSRILTLRYLLTPPEVDHQLIEQSRRGQNMTGNDAWRRAGDLN